MRFLPTPIHGVLDWILGPLLIALPWLLGFAEGGAEGGSRSCSRTAGRIHDLRGSGEAEVTPRRYPGC